MSLSKITFVIPSRNNLEFLQLAYESIRKLDTKHEILILNDASTDGTQEWIDNHEDEDLISFTNPGPERIGIVGMFDRGIEMARTDIICAFHADMVVCKDYDKNILKHLEKGTVVTGTRVEPPLHPDGPEKVLRNFGVEVEEFNMDFWLKESENIKEDRTTDGIFAPWCMYKEDFLAVGGHDELFAPQSKEDSDIFNRFQLNGYKFIQPWDALVYHFTSRGSRFNKHAGGSAGQNSQEWLYTTTKNMRNFIRKWGTVVLHDSTMKPIIPPKYNTKLILVNTSNKLLEILEPWFDVIAVDKGFDYQSYITKEQPNTIIDLSKRIEYNGTDTISADIFITIDANKFDNTDFSYIQNLSQIIEDSGEEGQVYQLGNLTIKVIKKINYVKNLIKV